MCLADCYRKPFLTVFSGSTRSSITFSSLLLTPFTLRAKSLISFNLSPNVKLYVANTEKGQIVRIAINPDGSAGTPEVLVADPATLVGVDGLALDVHGNIFAVNVAANLLLQIALDGAPPVVTILATADDGLDGPASLAFGTGKGERQSLFITNFALLSGQNPALLKVDAGVPGQPLP